MSKYDEKLESLKQKRTETDEKIKKLQDNKREDEKKERLKKQIILGQLMMTKMENDKSYSDEILIKLDDKLTKTNDRKLFDLQPTQTNHDNSTFTKNTDESGFIKHDEDSDLH